jgi:hypothetical protein
MRAGNRNSGKGDRGKTAFGIFMDAMPTFKNSQPTDLNNWLQYGVYSI